MKSHEIAIVAVILGALVTLAGWSLYQIGYRDGDHAGYMACRQAIQVPGPLHPDMAARGWRAESTRDTPTWTRVGDRYERADPELVCPIQVPRLWPTGCTQFPGGGAYCERAITDEEIAEMEAGLLERGVRVRLPARKGLR